MMEFASKLKNLNPLFGRTNKARLIGRMTDQNGEKYLAFREPNGKMKFVPINRFRLY